MKALEASLNEWRRSPKLSPSPLTFTCSLEHLYCYTILVLVFLHLNIQEIANVHHLTVSHNDGGGGGGGGTNSSGGGDGGCLSGSVG